VTSADARVAVAGCCRSAQAAGWELRAAGAGVRGASAVLLKSSSGTSTTSACKLQCEQ
jgi:hypothetical protein